MANCSLEHFRVGDGYYHHFINIETDATHVTNDLGEVVYTVDSDAYVYDGAVADGKRIGRFRTEFGLNNWSFITDDGSKIVTSFRDLLQAERYVFKILLTEKAK